jgi:glycine/D-amino acid oxidase-like deaminating enzyme
MLQKKFFDYIIIGQGICGTWLSYYLQKAGKTVLVLDASSSYTASKVASGVINPVTGRRIVRTWRIEELLPFSLSAYSELGKELGIPLIKEMELIDFHPSQQMQEAFQKRLPEESEYLHHAGNTEAWKKYFNFYFEAGVVSPCLLVDIHPMLSGWRRKLLEKNALFETVFSWQDCKVSKDEVSYKDITAQKIICCEGVAGFDNPYFKNLPYSRMKGEVIIASIPGLPRNKMYKQGLTIVPWYDDLFWIGSSYEWKFDHVNPTEAFRKKVEQQLKNWVRIPVTIVDHIASERPANMERRPFVGLHPVHSTVGIFNGMGTKGCSLAPFFAHQFANHLVNDAPIYPDADVQRFKKIISTDFNG